MMVINFAPKQYRMVKITLKAYVKAGMDENQRLSRESEALEGK